jgi:hypothetical protein
MQDSAARRRSHMPREHENLDSNLGPAAQTTTIPSCIPSKSLNLSERTSQIARDAHALHGLLQSAEHQATTSHLTTLVHRFLETLENVKAWNQLQHMKGEAELRHHVSNIIECTFYFHKQHITEHEVEKLTQILEKRGE